LNKSESGAWFNQARVEIKQDKTMIDIKIGIMSPASGKVRKLD
jgi:hypothetical protein